ncbi:unnamed protein product [Ectocarpus sp. CCAP 1310/34]|nr:unnamed protein product [Ectocarpus sp. CCAP 1310/34]
MRMQNESGKEGRFVLGEETAFALPAKTHSGQKLRLQDAWVLMVLTLDEATLQDVGEYPASIGRREQDEAGCATTCYLCADQILVHAGSRSISRCWVCVVTSLVLQRDAAKMARIIRLP